MIALAYTRFYVVVKAKDRVLACLDRVQGPNTPWGTWQAIEDAKDDMGTECAKLAYELGGLSASWAAALSART